MRSLRQLRLLAKFVGIMGCIVVGIGFLMAMWLLVPYVLAGG